VTVCEGGSERLYLPADLAQTPAPPSFDADFLKQPITNDRRWFSPPLYGMTEFYDLFTPRQRYSLTVLAESIQEVGQCVQLDASRSGQFDDDRPLNNGGAGAVAYADAIKVYLSCALSRMTDYHCSLATWNPTNENVRNLFQRQAIPMAWDYAEANPIKGKLSYDVAVEWVVGALSSCPLNTATTRVIQNDARVETPTFRRKPVISTDPPYFDNISYADLSDFFHIPPNLVVDGVPTQRKPPEVRICKLSIQSAVGTRPPSTSTPHCPACLARR
jgi:putative DNA methylase